MAVLAYASQVRSEERVAREEALARYGGEQVEVCVASHDIAAGDTIKVSDVQRELWLSDLLPSECISNENEVVGAVAGSSILAKEPISRARLGNTNSDIDVPVGLCAVSIPAQDVRAVGGAIGRGSLVNVYANSASGVTLLGENLLVLATSGSEKSSSSSHSTLSWVTLAVTQESVQELLAASKSEALYLTLPGVEGNAQDAKSSASASASVRPEAWIDEHDTWVADGAADMFSNIGGVSHGC